jgi:uncharacterized protein (TIGR03435 family)
MRNHAIVFFVVVALLPTSVASAQTAHAPQAPARSARLAFEVASIKLAPPLDKMKIKQEEAQGQMPRIGPRIDGSRAEYRSMTLRELMVVAYKVQANQITGPDWIDSQRFDIAAKLPDESTKDQANEMLQSLLEERFKMTLHRETKDHPVFALLVGKDGPKMRESPPDPSAPLDTSAPLKPGEMQMDTDSGPVRITRGNDDSATLNMGAKGTVRTVTSRLDRSTRTIHVESSNLTMDAFATILTMYTQKSAGRPVVDMTGLKGNYQVALDLSLPEEMAMARSALPELAGAAPPAGTSADAASEPGGTASIFTSVKALGLRLEQRKAPIEQLVIDHVEKTPIEN